MITPEFCQMMARYNAWQNRSLLGAADGLSDAERTKERGAFFGSIHGTLSHILWGDGMWLNRFAGWDAPEGGIPDSSQYLPDWTNFKAARSDFDMRLIGWVGKLTPADMTGDLTWYSGAMKRDVGRPRDELLVHIFNHQTHHRGQVHAMLTAAGAKPGDTDIPFMPQED